MRIHSAPKRVCSSARGRPLSLRSALIGTCAEGTAVVLGLGLRPAGDAQGNEKRLWSALNAKHCACVRVRVRTLACLRVCVRGPRHCCHCTNISQRGGSQGQRRKAKRTDGMCAWRDEGRKTCPSAKCARLCSGRSGRSIQPRQPRWCSGILRETAVYHMVRNRRRSGKTGTEDVPGRQVV